MATKKSKERSSEHDEIDALFKLPPTEFTAARNALATRLKKAGDAEQAEAVKRLQKPPISAWTVNQLFWKHRGPFNRLIEAGEKFRTAQAAQLSGRSIDIRGPLEARREALADLSKIAAQVLREAHHPVSPEVMRRVTTTLEALATYGGLEGTPQPGRLSDDVDPPGFETLAALVPRVGKGAGVGGPSRVLTFQQIQPKKERPHRKLSPEDAAREREAEQKARVAAAKSAVQASEQAVREARKEAEHAEALLKKAAARAKETEKESREIEQEKAAIDRRFEQASAEAEAARQEARRIAEQAEAAAEAVEDAERELERVQRELKALEE
jgi:hypothetical protein